MCATTKPKPKKCLTRYCKREVKRGRYCFTCTSRRSRAANPLKWSYWNLKANSKRRGKEFSLTMDEFRQFCEQTNYLAGKGRTLLCYSIDRIDNTKGYSLDNIRRVTVRENSRKGTKILHYDWETKFATVTTHRRDPELDDWFDSYVKPEDNVKNHF
jgi:hypothetical protein